MHVGIYNRWLSTLGGGEKHSLAIAEYISQYHTVTVITHTPVPKDRAANKLNIDLSRVKFLTIPERLAIGMTPITSKYDFFITTSFMDYFPSKAPISATLIFFPTPVGLEPIMRLRRRFKLALQRWLMVPSFFEGVINLQVTSNSQLRWLDYISMVRLPASSKTYRCKFDIASGDKNINRARMFLNDEILSVIDLPKDLRFTHFEFITPATLHTAFPELRIQAIGRDEKPEESGNTKLLLRNFGIAHPRHHLYQLMFEHWLRNWGLRMHYVPPGVFSILDSIDTYDAIWANSKYTQKWITRYWKRPSEVLYPPIDVDSFHPVEKRDQIISVGRYFAGSHNKKHMDMIRAFKDMVDNGLQGWKLVLVGSTTPGLVHEKYLSRLERESQGYPIAIYKDIPFEKLVQLYGESAIYWHASGYGENENLKPKKFEHFGITTVEAMASGCVPVVIGLGGQPEIVRHGNNGFLWQRRDDLIKLTYILIQNPNQRKSMANAALVDSRRYDKKFFNIRLQQLIEELG